jgi:hypothetical protein
LYRLAEEDPLNLDKLTLFHLTNILIYFYYSQILMRDKITEKKLVHILFEFDYISRLRIIYIAMNETNIRFDRLESRGQLENNLQTLIL